MSENIKYVIKSNNVREVKSIENGKGIISEGSDSLGNSIVIQNLDAGKSVELMNIALMEEDNSKRGLLFPIIIGVGLLIVVVVGFLMFSGSDPVAMEPQEDIAIFQEEASSILPVTTPQQDIQQDVQSIESIRMNYEHETLQIELEKTIAKNIEINEIIDSLEEDNRLLEIENENLMSQLQEIQDKPRNIESEEFLLYLGTEVSKLCEKSEVEREKNKCKDLFYKFVKNG